MTKLTDPERKYIVFVVMGIYPCTTGGVEIFYNKLIPEIAKNEDVILITNCKRIKPVGYRINKISEKILFIPGTSKLASILFTSWALVGLRKNIKIVHLPYTSNAGYWGFVFPSLKKRFGINYLLHIHGGGMRPWGTKNKDKVLFNYADRIIAVSNVIKEEYEKRSGKNIKIVLPLVPFKSVSDGKQEIRINYRFHPQDRIILFVGSLKEIKSPEVLLDAFLSIDKSLIIDKKLKLIFVGDGILKDKLKIKVRSSGYDEYVSFIGRVPYQDIPFFYKMSDIYVIPSKFEGTPKSLLEAMFNKLPIIGANVDGINNILRDNEDALLFESGNSEDLKIKIIYLLQNDEKLNYLSNAAWIKFSNFFSYQTTIQELLKIYNGY